jgi:hypothetical protein
VRLIERNKGYLCLKFNLKEWAFNLGFYRLWWGREIFVIEITEHKLTKKIHDRRM